MAPILSPGERIASIPPPGERIVQILSPGEGIASIPPPGERIVLILAPGERISGSLDACMPGYLVLGGFH